MGPKNTDDESSPTVERGLDEPRANPAAHAGVKKVEAALRIYGRYSRWCLFTGLALASYIYSLDASTTSAYLTFATSSFGEHSLLSSIAVVQSLIVAVGKPAIAKIADVSSRGSAYVGVLFFYVLGYIVIASTQSVGTIAGGIVLYSIGYTYANHFTPTIQKPMFVSSGLQILTQIIIADITTLKWRGFVASLVSAPFLVNAFIGSNISASVIEHVGWRWGYGMFAILVPASLCPLIITLLWAERKTKRLGLVKSNDGLPVTTDEGYPKDTLLRRLQRTIIQLDLVGLILLGTAVSLILLPLTLNQTMRGGWKNASVISMLVVGVVFLGLFAYWDFSVATRPVISPHLLTNRNVVFASVIGFFDFLIFYLTFIYLYSFILVVKSWSLVDSTYFMQTQTVALTFFGILAGVAMRFLRRFKYILMLGLIIRLVGVAVMIRSRGANGSTVELVFTQILQGFGGGLVSVSAQVGAQAAVPHVDVAVTTALFLLLTEIGGAVGNAVSGAIWSNTMPRNLARYLPWLTDAQRAELYGSITSVTNLPLDDPVRQGVIQAYEETMKVMILCAIGLSAFLVVFSLGIPDMHLGDKQNAVDSLDLTGRPSTTEEDCIVEEQVAIGDVSTPTSPYSR